MDTTAPDGESRARPSVVAGSVAAGFVALALFVGAVAVSFGYVDTYDIPFWPHREQEFRAELRVDCEPLLAMTAADAGAYMAAHGYEVRWQIDNSARGASPRGVDRPPPGAHLARVGVTDEAQVPRAVLAVRPAEDGRAGPPVIPSWLCA